MNPYTLLVPGGFHAAANRPASPASSQNLEISRLAYRLVDAIDQAVQRLTKTKETDHV